MQLDPFQEMCKEIWPAGDQKIIWNMTIVICQVKSIQKTSTARENKVTGTPTVACSLKVTWIPKLAACSMTIRLAMLPTMIRLPANVLDTASVYHSTGRPESRNRTRKRNL